MAKIVAIGNFTRRKSRKTRLSGRFEQNRCGAPDRIRTYGFLLRRQTLYPLSYWGTSQSFIIR